MSQRVAVFPPIIRPICRAGLFIQRANYRVNRAAGTRRQLEFVNRARARARARGEIAYSRLLNLRN